MTIRHFRKSLGRSLSWRSGFVLVPLALVCFGLSPAVRAVNPPPDGFYPVWNTAEGQDALFSRTTGNFNTAIGAHALYLDTTGTSNTAVGAFTMAANTGGNQNVAVGQGTLGNNTGSFNAALGFKALVANSTGSGNVAIGYLALSSNTTQGINNTDGTSVAIGYQALQHNTAQDNNAVGHDALQNNTAGLYNNAFGWHALLNNLTGDFNTAIGDGAGSAITGNGNVCVGASISGLAGENNTTRIRNIGSTFQNSGIYVTLDSVGGTRLGYVNLSSRRYKDDIKPMEGASEALFALKPVTFRYKKEFDPSHGPGYGLIAEEVEKINPDLVSHNDKGEVMTVRYDAVNAMLLNEFLKEHKKVEEQQASIAELKKEIGTLTATVKEQATQIQKVSAQVEMSKPTAKVVNNNK